MKLLGAVLAGGAARRFGSDKALALLDGRALIDHVLARLEPQCTALVVVGRRYGGWPTLADRPDCRAGPLAGLNAALHHAAAWGYDAVLSAPCDMPDLPADLAEQLGTGPAVLADHPVVGLWPAALAPRLDDWLAGRERAVRGFAAAAGARGVASPRPLVNLNHRADLTAYAQSSESGSGLSPSAGSSLSTQPG